ncbi:MAG: cytochrome c family protein [Gammaproteobacteria bacterium]|nr:MAG: cytochrome c family protein [Gammaproteobacteria bacterium]TND06237.1 MAG: cytochrome c family protein [Gammaproteobacteria bacterium]
MKPGRLRPYWSTLLVVTLLGLSGTATAGIANTKHNLGMGGVNAASNFSGTPEVCVFCHTPHGADATAAVPLWNRHLAEPRSFTTYDQLGTTTLDASIEPIGSVSIACLSCHDGTQAMDSLINEPGSGADVQAFSNGVWSGQAATVGGRLGPATVITNLGKDLTNDHAIGVQFAGGGYSISNPAGPGRDPDFNRPETAFVGDSRFWWLNTPIGTSNFERTDLKLYTRTGTLGVNVGELQPYVECASCHDPHVDENPTFLRIDPSGSAVCLTCHAK